MNAVQVENLTKKFGQLTAVNGISFDIKKGEIFGLLGPNGSGKSTTIRMLCGVITPTDGNGSIMGFDLYKDTESIKKEIGYMSQRFSLYGDLTVNENLGFFGEIFGMSRSDIDERRKELVEMVELEGKEGALAATLSGGMQQRLALGCALIHNPSLLVLDEPTAGIDPVSRRVFWDKISLLAHEGVTVLVTTHYMDEAEVCDRIGFLYNGDLISVDTPEGHCASMGMDNLEDVFIHHVHEHKDRKAIYSYRQMKERIRHLR